MVAAIIARIRDIWTDRAALAQYAFVKDLPFFIAEPGKDHTAKLRRNPVPLGREWQKAFDEDKVSSKAELARKLGVTPARAAGYRIAQDTLRSLLRHEPKYRFVLI